MATKPLELQSLKWPFVGLAVLLALSTLWAVYDEVVPLLVAAGCRTIFIDLGYIDESAEGADFVAPSLGEAARIILRQRESEC